MATTQRHKTLIAFNKLFFEFLDDIIEIIDDYRDIKLARNQFALIKGGSVSILIKVWYDFIFTPYWSIIETGDISFFINKDYSEDLTYLDQDTSKEIVKCINRLREPIRTMSQNSQQICAEYIYGLSKLSNEYHNNI